MSESIKVMHVVSRADDIRDLRVVVEVRGDALYMAGLVEFDRYGRRLLPSPEKLAEALEKIFATYKKGLQICASEHAPLRALEKTLERLRETIAERTEFVEKAVVEEQQ